MQGAEQWLPSAVPGSAAYNDTAGVSVTSSLKQKTTVLGTTKEHSYLSGSNYYTGSVTNVSGSFEKTGGVVKLTTDLRASSTWTSTLTQGTFQGINRDKPFVSIGLTGTGGGKGWSSPGDKLGKVVLTSGLLNTPLESHTIAATQDIERITKMLTTPRGLMWETHNLELYEAGRKSKNYFATKRGGEKTLAFLKSLGDKALKSAKLTGLTLGQVGLDSARGAHITNPYSFDLYISSIGGTVNTDADKTVRDARELGRVDLSGLQKAIIVSGSKDLGLPDVTVEPEVDEVSGSYNHLGVLTDGGAYFSYGIPKLQGSDLASRSKGYYSSGGLQRYSDKKESYYNPKYDNGSDFTEPVPTLDKINDFSSSISQFYKGLENMLPSASGITPTAESFRGQTITYLPIIHSGSGLTEAERIRTAGGGRLHEFPIGADNSSGARAGILNGDINVTTLQDASGSREDIWIKIGMSGGILEFRAYLESYSDDYQGSWDGVQYVGRADNFYVYKGFTREISFNFKIVVASAEDLQKTYKDINKLVSLTAPKYSDAFMQGEITELTIGNLLNSQPGFFKNVNISWDQETPWEVEPGRQVPQILDAKVSFTPIHKSVPVVDPVVDEARYMANPLGDYVPGSDPLVSASAHRHDMWGVTTDRYVGKIRYGSISGSSA